MRGQATAEFIILYSALLVAFVVVFAIYAGGSINLFQAQDEAAAMRNAEATAAALNFVYLAGDGASYNLTATGAVSSENITISQYAVTSSRQHGTASAPLLDSYVNASSIGSGPHIISNSGGEVNIR